MSGDEGIWQESPWPPDWNVTYVAQTGSTNADLLDGLAASVAGHRTVLAAGNQTAGRGRLDRRWDAPPATNLLVSIAFTEVPELPIELTHRVALALLAAVDDLARRGLVTAVPCGMKWPNDVLLGDRKLAGILAARAPVSGAVVVGLGVNVGWAPEGAIALGDVIHPAELLVAVLAAFDELPIDVEPLYRQRLLTLHQRVRAFLPDGTELVGRAVDVGHDGRLHLLDDCATTHHLDAADVVHLRPAND